MSSRLPPVVKLDSVTPSLVPATAPITWSASQGSVRGDGGRGAAEFPGSICRKLWLTERCALPLGRGRRAQRGALL